MPAIVVIGAQWGDEGKGKIVDLLAEQAQLVVRFSGGDNAGHTVINHKGEFKLHLIPSGIFRTETVCIIGNGVVVNPEKLLEEMADLEGRGVSTKNLFISDRANIIMPYHPLFDGLEEERRGKGALGTTRKGIGPAYSDKAARLGIRTCDLLDKKAMLGRLQSILEYKNDILTKVFNTKPLSIKEIYEQYCQYADRLAPHIRDTSLMVEDALKRGDVVLLEGAQGALLDPDFGTYPFTTSSSPLAGGACLGAGIGPTRINQVLGVFKAYCTRVGSGPFPSELIDATGDTIRNTAREYGTTTGRPRRCGWFDVVAARFSARINSFTGLALTRLDVLDNFPNIRISVRYRLDGREIDHFPACTNHLERCQPVYEEMPGWGTPIGNIREFEKLPPQAKKYVSRLEELIGHPVNLISVGASREQTIFKKPVL